MSCIHFWLWDILVILLVQNLLEPSPKPEDRKLPGRRSVKPDSRRLAFIAKSSETRQNRAKCHTFLHAQIQRMVYSSDIQLTHLSLLWVERKEGSINIQKDFAKCLNGLKMYPGKVAQGSLHWRPVNNLTGSRAAYTTTQQDTFWAGFMFIFESWFFFSPPVKKKTANQDKTSMLCFYLTDFLQSLRTLKSKSCHLSKITSQCPWHFCGVDQLTLVA